MASLTPNAKIAFIAYQILSSARQATKEPVSSSQLLQYGVTIVCGETKL